MNTEKLLICAERLGYEARAYKDKVEILFHDQNGTVGYWWNPLTNDAQAMELLKYYVKAKIKDSNPFYPSGLSEILDSVLNEDDEIDNEAIIKAVVAMEGEG